MKVLWRLSEGYSVAVKLFADGLLHKTKILQLFYCINKQLFMLSIKIDKLVKSNTPGHCEEYNDEAISKHVDNPQDCHVRPLYSRLKAHLLLAMTGIEQNGGCAKPLRTFG